MSSFPNRCQHLKINGTQCGSPALRRNRFCFFHKRFQDQRIQLHADRVRRGSASFVLPVLEDANSIQVALMQVMRLLVSKQIEHKTASLLLYALQTASTNLRRTNFNPVRHDVILDPRDASDTPLGERIWNDDDFDEEEEDEADSQSQAQQRRQQDEAATNHWVEELAKHYAEEGLRNQLRAAVQQARLEHAQKAAREKANREFQQREAERRAREQSNSTKAAQTQNQKPAANNGPLADPKAAASKPEQQNPEQRQVSNDALEKKPPSSQRPEEVRAQIVGLIKEKLGSNPAEKFPPASAQLPGGSTTEKKAT